MVLAALVADPQIGLGQEDLHVQSGRSVFALQPPLDSSAVLGNGPENVLLETVQNRALALSPVLVIYVAQRRQKSCE